MKILSKHWLDNTEDTYILRLFQQERAGGRNFRFTVPQFNMEYSYI